MKTLKSFVASSHIDPSLIRSVVRQIGGWQEFKDHAEDVSNHGAAGGFVGFTYYADTVEFTKRNKKAVIALCEQTASDCCNEGLIEFLANFNCLKDYKQSEVADGLYNPRSDSKTAIYNALAWFALEEVCRAYADNVECN